MEESIRHAQTSFACVRCRGDLIPRSGQLVCEVCGEAYSTIADSLPILMLNEDIPKFVPDPGMSFEESVALAERLAALPGSFRDLVNYYYEACRDRIGPQLFDYYRNIVAARDVGDFSDEVCAASLGLNLLERPFPRTRLAVEIGVGWGFSLAALGKAYRDNPQLGGARLCGFDLNPAILVIAQRLFQDLGLGNVELAVADAERPLPLRPGSVDFLFASSVVEHLPNQRMSMDHMAEVLSCNAVMYFCVPNRYMLHPEPHFGRRWVGFVPRRWQKQYVGRRMGLPPQEIATIWSYSPQDLARLLCPSFPNDQIAVLPVNVPLTRRADRLLARAVPSLGVGHYHCVVCRSPGVGNPARPRGVVHLGSIVGRDPLRVVRTIVAGASREEGRGETWLDYAQVGAGAKPVRCSDSWGGVQQVEGILVDGLDRAAAVTQSPPANDTREDDGDWFLLDLGGRRTISAVEIAWRTPESCPDEFVLECGEPDAMRPCFEERRAGERTRQGVYWRRLSQELRTRFLRFRLPAASGGSPRIQRFSLWGRGPAPKRALMLAPDCYTIDRRILQEARSLQKKAFRVTLLCGFECASDEFFLDHGIEIHRFRFDWDDERIKGIRTWLQSPWLKTLVNKVFLRCIRPLLRDSSFDVFMRTKAAAFPSDVVHVHDLPCLKAGARLAREWSAPLIFDAHEIYWEQEVLPAPLRTSLRRLEKRLMPAVDELIVTNPASQSFHRSRYGRDACVLMNACEMSVPRIRPESLPLEALRQGDKKVLMYQGVLAPERNLANLVRSARHLPENVVLAIVGGGPYEAELRELAQQEGCQRSVVFTGMVPSDRMRDYTLSADLGLIPYLPIDANHRLCSPNKFFEFVREGLPILFHHELEFLQMMERQYGVCVPVDMRDPKALAAAAIDVLSDPERLALLRRACLDARSDLSWEAQERELFEIYHRVLETAA